MLTMSPVLGGSRNQSDGSWVLSTAGEALSGITGHPVRYRYRQAMFLLLLLLCLLSVRSVCR